METTAPTGAKAKRWHGFAKAIRYTVLALVAVSAIWMYWRYYYTYSEGFKTGVLVKFEHKGYMFKTNEGEMLVVGNAAYNISNENFIFSVTDDKVKSMLDTLQGKLLMLHYEQKNNKLFWRGESVFIVDSVKTK